MSTSIIGEPLEGEDNIDFDELENDITSDEDTSGVPDKFKEKSKEDIVKSYIELEKTIGKQGSELGELRKLTDQYIQQQLTTKNQVKEEEEVSDDDFFDSPTNSINKILDKRPEHARLDALERQLEFEKFSNRHPDWMDEVKTEDFASWVKNSKTRQNLYVKGDQGDFSSASELLDLWKERQELVKAASERDKSLQSEEREETLKKATSESSSNRSGKTSKTYRRADLIRLQLTDPQKYEAMQDEIMLAYAEKRVKQFKERLNAFRY